MLKFTAALILVLAVSMILQIDNEKSFSAFASAGPVLSITSPASDTSISTGSHIVTGTASDTGGKIRGVLVMTTSGQFAKATPKSATDWSTWSIPINFTSTGPNTITARAVDDAGNSAHTSIQVMVGTTVITTVPSAPQNLQASGSQSQVSLTWQQATLSSGGTPITNYKIYRSLASSSETLYATVGNVLSYNDMAVTNGQTYYYKVSAVNAVGESKQSNEASASPIPNPTRDKTIISFIRPDLDPTSLANVAQYVKSFSKPTDYVFGGGITGVSCNWAVVATVPGQLMTGGNGNDNSQWQGIKAQHGITTVFFDEEPTLSLADLEAGYKTAHSLGLQFVTTPTYKELIADPTVVTTVAQNSDIFNLQIFPGMTFTGPDAGLTYVQVVQKYELAARQANPNVKVFVQYVSGDHKTNSDMTQQIAAFNSIKSYVDGVFIWYYQSPDPTPYLKQFYQGTGLG
jgi:hypothetical protein